jgi:hypothetical protein
MDLGGIGVSFAVGLRPGKTDSSPPERQPPGACRARHWVDRLLAGGYTNDAMRPSRLLALILSSAFATACTTGSTQVQGLPEETETSRPTGPTATGPTAATGVTGAGEAFSLVFEIPPEAEAFISEAAFFTCDGLEGTWRYLFQADFGQGINLDVDTTVDMAGGDGTLVFGGDLNIQGGSVSFTDTVELEITGTADAPALIATSVEVDLSGSIEGIPVSFFETFQQNEELPIVPGSDRC